MLLRVRPAAAGLVFALGVLAGPAAAQQQLTVERVFSRDFRVQGVPAAHWMNDGQRFSYLKTEGETTNLVAEDARTGQTTVLVEGARLVPPGAQKPIEIEDYTWSDDERKLLIYTESQPVWRQNTKGKFYVYEVATGRLQPVSTAPGWQQFAKFSPDATKVGFVRDNDLWVADLATGQETRLTRDGSETIINGTFDWVYEEELGLQDGWRWSPDGARIAYWRLDQSPVRTFTWLNDTDSAYARAIDLRYPKAGAPNPTARIGVYELAGGQTRWIDTGADSLLLGRMEWAESPTELVIQRLTRIQNQLDVLVADVRTGAVRTVLTDTDPAWVDVDDDLTFINGGRQFLWSSERDGYNHLYVYNRDGTLARQLTRGSWDVAQVVAVDADGGWVYYTSTEAGPEERQLYRIRLNGSGKERLTREEGTHSILTVTTKGPYYLSAHSRAGVPPVIRLFRGDGTLVRTVQDNAPVRAKLAELNVNLPEFFSFRTSDGAELNGWMIKPPAFDPGKKYPVLMYVYGGPGSQTVVDVWGGSRYLWHQLLAQRGYLVVSVDNRGTGGRGREFKKVTYLNLGEREARDQIEAARYLSTLPYVDSQRLGIWGWSYGGYMTALTMMTEGSPFKAGISVAPVADWRLYDTIYTERFMSTPQANPTGYDRSSPVRKAASLKGDLLLIHGTGDDNVHFQNSVQLANALQEANKQFTFMLYPDRNHSIAGGRTIHLHTLMTNWITENL